MPTNQAIFQNYAEHTVNFDFSVTGGTGAVASTRGDGIIVTRTGAGVYTVRVNRIDFYEVTRRSCQLHQATPTAFWAAITDVDLDGAGDGTGAVITVKILDDNATPTVTELAADGVVSGAVVFRRWKIVSP